MRIRSWRRSLTAIAIIAVVGGALASGVLSGARAQDVTLSAGGVSRQPANCRVYASRFVNPRQFILAVDGAPAAAAGFALACPGVANARPASAAPPAATPAASPAAASPVAAVRAVLKLEDIFMDPTALSIPAHTDAAVVAVENHGASVHNFSVDGTTITSGDLLPREKKDVIVNLPPGTYTYYCDIPGHRAAGMIGTLTVK